MVFTFVPVAMLFNKFPKTCPELLDMLPEAGMIIVLLPVVITPEVKLRTPFTVAFTLPPKVSPLLLLSVTSLNMVAVLPRMFWGTLPLNVTVPLSGVVSVPPLFIQSPPTFRFKLFASNWEFAPRVMSFNIVMFESNLTIGVPVLFTVKL